jgi:DNA-binding CsgD family transcriptional regulator
MPSALPRLSALITQAPGSPDGWRDLLVEFGAVFRSRFAGFVHFEKQTNSGLSLAVTEDPRFIAEYDAYYNTVNPWIIRGAQLFELGTVLPSQALVPINELERTEFYNDYLRRYSFAHTLGACINLGVRTTHLTLGRGLREGVFSAEEVRFLEAFVSQVRNAIAIDRHIATINAVAQSALEELEQLQYALVIMRGARVVYANEAARALERLRVCDLANGTLRFDDASAQLQFSRRQSEAAQCLASAVSPISMPFVTGSADGRRFRVSVGVARRPGPAGISTGVLVIIEEVRSAVSLERRLLQTPLSNREREIAMLIISGRNPAEVARALSIAASTVRLHLKRIYRKLHVSGYVDLRRRYAG